MAIVAFFATNLELVSPYVYAIGDKYVITGGERAAHISIFKWMFDCCMGNGMVDWPKYGWRYEPFFQYAGLRHACHILGCSYLEHEFTSRMADLAGKQLRANDVEITYNAAGRGSKLANVVVESVARLFLLPNAAQMNLQAYQRICERNAAFKQDLEDAIGLKLAFRRFLGKDAQQTVGLTPENENKKKSRSGAGRRSAQKKHRQATSAPAAAI